MDTEKLFKILYWVLFASAAACLYISLRTQYYQIEYSILALAFWGAAYGVNRYYGKKE